MVVILLVRQLKCPTLFPPPRVQLLLPYNPPSSYASHGMDPKSAHRIRNRLFKPRPTSHSLYCMSHSLSLISRTGSLDTAAICPSVIKLAVTTSCGKKVVQRCCVGARGSGGELPVAIALNLVLALWVFDKGAETLVLAAKGPGSWWVMRAPGGVDRVLGLRVWGEQCTTKKSSCVNACVMMILPGTAYELKKSQNDD